MKIPEVLLLQSRHKAGSLARILAVLGDAGVRVEGLKAIHRDNLWTTWELTVEPDEGQPLDPVVQAIDALDNAHILGRSDRVFDRHRGGKLDVVSRLPIDTDEVLRDLYTPGVARVCLAIAEDPARARELTSLGKTVAIVTNGTAVLGLGAIGPVAGLPVMEGKAALLREFAGLSGVPILIESEDPETIVETVARIAPSFGAIQLEDISAPACFEIESALLERLDRPVMHDDQHGTAAVVLAALLAAAREAGLDLHRATVGQIGLGAAGLGICELLHAYGVRDLVGADLDEGALALFEARGGRRSDLAGVLAEADAVIATTGVPGLIPPESVRPGQVLLALGNPDPEIEPETARARGAAYAADGTGVNNVLGFPGIFRGALEAGARRITQPMLIAAAEALASMPAPSGLIPEPLDRTVHTQVAEAVRQVAEEEANSGR